MILAPLQKLPNNGDNLGKIIVATGFEWLPKVRKIAQSGHTELCYEKIIEQKFIWTRMLSCRRRRRRQCNTNNHYFSLR